MKFKIGDKVKVTVKYFNIFDEVGEIYDYDGTDNTYLVCFEEGYIRWIFEKNISLLDEKGEWNNMNNFEELLEIYKERMCNLIDDEYNKNIDEFFLKDDIQKIKDDIIKKIFNDYPDFKEMIDINLKVVPTDKGKNEIAVMTKERTKKVLDLTKLLEEVKAQLSLAETYEQKIDILVRYEILDKKTKKIAI